MNRRTLIKGLASFSAIGLGTAAYGIGLEAGMTLNTKAYALTPPRWTPGLKLRAVVIADPHLVEPWFPLSRWQKVIEVAQALNPEIVFMLGDYLPGIHKLSTGSVPVSAIAKAAAKLKAPLGVFSINGNHDWWEDAPAQKAQKGPTEIERAFEDAGIPVLSNKAMRLKKDGMPFWVSGTDSTVAIRNRDWLEGMDDLPGTMAQIKDDAPIIHLAHEPDLFADTPERISLVLSGHTHGGQMRLFGQVPFIASPYGRKHYYGHYIEDGRHLIVSGGLGCSHIPMRLGSPPEINLVELG